MTTIGIIKATGNLRGGCLNSATGRYYVATDGPYALTRGEARATPSQAGSEHREFYDQEGGDDEGLKPARSTAACDPLTSRVFMHAQQDGDNLYMVFKDSNPPHLPRSAPDPDSLTHNVPDDPKVSTAYYNSVGRAFGARFVAPGGPVAWSKTLGGPEGAGITNPLSAGLGPATGDFAPSANRSLVFARVGVGEKSVTLSNGGVAAAAVGGSHDEATDNNFTANGSRPSPWPFDAVSCPHHELGNEVSGRGARVRCQVNVGSDGEPPGAVGHAEAHQRNLDSEDALAALVSLEGIEATVETHLDSELGIVTTAEARVRSASLGAGRIVLEDVQARAKAWAAGLARKAGAEYERSIGRLIIDGNEVCWPCDPQEVADAITQATRQVVAVSVPQVDPRLEKGTPKGAQAAIMRHPFEQLTDETLHGVPSDDQQVPALRLLFQPRGFHHNVMVVDLAAPQVMSTRFLVPCPFCGLTPDAGGSQPAGDPPSGVQEPDVVLPPIDAGSRAELVVAGSDPVGESITYITNSQVGSSDSRGLAQGPGNLVERIFEAVRKGLDTLFTDPGKIPMLLAVWAVILSPVYLSARRRLILLRQQAR